MLEIIGSGLGRTGTLSLKTALEMLGFGPCHHMLEVAQHLDSVPLWRRAGAGEPVEWDELLGGYRSTTDWPSARFWRDTVARYPDAKVILTERDPERWYESVRETIYQVSTAPMEGAPELRQLADMARELIWDGTFGGRFADRAHAIDVFNRHNQAVRDEVPSDRLLVYEVGQGWEPLCAFLGVPIPDEPFPRTNERAAFHEMIEDQLD